MYWTARLSHLLESKKGKTDMTANIKLKYPNMRDELIDCLEALSDHEYQRAA